MAKNKRLNCIFVAQLNDRTMHNIKVMDLDPDVPQDYIWSLAMKECNKFDSPLQKLAFVVKEITT